MFADNSTQTRFKNSSTSSSAKSRSRKFHGTFWKDRTSRCFVRRTSLVYHFKTFRLDLFTYYKRDYVSQDLPRVVMTCRLTRCIYDAEKSLSRERSLAFCVVPLFPRASRSQFSRGDDLFFSPTSFRSRDGLSWKRGTARRLVSKPYRAILALSVIPYSVR